LPTAPRCPLQFAKAGSAATLSQQEKSNSGVALSLAAMYLADSFAAGAPPPTHVWSFFTPPVPAEQHLGVGLQRPCRGQT
jgi:hypothetical protein